MVTLSWGNLLALILPGMVVLAGFEHLSPRIATLLASPNAITVPAGTLLLLLAALCGGVLEGARLVSLDWLLARQFVWPPIYEHLGPENLAVFEAGVENSYRYYGFYANLAGAVVFLLIAKYIAVGLEKHDGILFLTVVVAFVAAIIQYRNFAGFVRGFVTAAKHRPRKGEQSRAN